MGIIDEVRPLKPAMVERRRDFHQHPELAFEEVRTAGIVAETLNGLGLEVQTGVGKTGVVGILEGAQDGPTLLIRADMDALPIHEETDADYASKTAGKMHACGHDGHTTIALTAARLLNDRRAAIKGRVKFVFQPAEEIGEGAEAMIADGALDNPRPDFSIGLHLWNDLPVGTVGVTAGPSMSAAARFTITVTGSGGHGAQPHKTVDPIVAAAQIVSALQAIVSRNTDPLEAAVVTVGAINGGEAFNVIPPTVTLKGTIRTYRPEVEAMVYRRVHEIAEGVGQAMGCTVDTSIASMTKAVNNHPEVSERVREVAERVVGAQNVRTDVRTMGSEDVSLFMDDIPGCYFFVGSANAEHGLDAPHHHPAFDIDEESLVIGAAMLAEVAASYLID
ncbi:MAG: M20 family metallopeptidase [Anaerolineae bacterium]